MKVLYIAGSGRSGTTFLDRVMGQIDGFFSAGELDNIWQRGLLADRMCGCGTPFHSCPTWTAILKRAFDGCEVDVRWMSGIHRQRTRPAQAPPVLIRGFRLADPVTAQYRETLRRLYQAVEEQTGCRVIVDSSKSPLYAELLATLPQVDLHLVHLVRDPRATAYSFQRRKKLPDFGDERLMQRQPPLVSARRWSLWQAVTELLGRRRPDRYLRIRYEDLVREPQLAVGRVLGLLGETPLELPFSSKTTVRLQPTHTVSGNPNRFTSGDVEVRDDDEWVDLMRRMDRVLVTALTWPLLLRYHYRLRPTPQSPEQRT